MKSNKLVYLVVCFIMIQGGYSSKARKRTTSCEIPKDVRGNWRAPDFETKKGNLRLAIDIGATSAKLKKKLGDDNTEIEFDCTAGSDEGFFLTKSKVPEKYNSLAGEMKAIYKLEPFTCFRFDKIDSFLKVNMYSFKKKPGSQDATQVCSGMEKQKTFNTIGFSPADQFNDSPAKE